MLWSIIWLCNTICLEEMENEPLPNPVCLTYFTISFIYYIAVVCNMLESHYAYQYTYNAIYLSIPIMSIK